MSNNDRLPTIEERVSTVSGNLGHACWCAHGAYGHLCTACQAQEMIAELWAGLQGAQAAVVTLRSKLAAEETLWNNLIEGYVGNAAILAQERDEARAALTMSQEFVEALKTQIIPALTGEHVRGGEE